MLPDNTEDSWRVYWRVYSWDLCFSPHEMCHIVEPTISYMASWGPESIINQYWNNTCADRKSEIAGILPAASCSLYRNRYITCLSHVHPDQKRSPTRLSNKQLHSRGLKRWMGTSCEEKSKQKRGTSSLNTQVFQGYHRVRIDQHADFNLHASTKNPLDAVHNTWGPESILIIPAPTERVTLLASCQQLLAVFTRTDTLHVWRMYIQIRNDALQNGPINNCTARD
jgi:hypothetical protein